MEVNNLPHAGLSQDQSVVFGLSSRASRWDWRKQWGISLAYYLVIYSNRLKVRSWKETNNHGRTRKPAQLLKGRNHSWKRKPYEKPKWYGKLWTEIVRWSSIIRGTILRT